ncbi:MAG: cellulase family glycosylhydrolase [Chitinophagaceae bacterium]|nr:cellulase family glycosylhydrolase [Anaerolineae bacterium]
MKFFVLKNSLCDSLRPLRLYGLFFFFLLITACTSEPAPPNRSGLQAATPIPTLNTGSTAALCEEINANWGRDWPVVIQSLETLAQMNSGDTACDPAFSVSDRLYAAYLTYGTLLEQRNRPEEAAAAYETALEYNFNGRDANLRLQGLQVATLVPPSSCDGEIVEHALAAMRLYVPEIIGSYVQVEGNDFTLDGQPFPVYGVNYYPRDYPGVRFLTQMDTYTLDYELDLMRASGINTLRIFLRHTDLFICPGNGAIPVAAAFARLDGLISAASQRGYKLILVLNVDADLVEFPLYNAPEFVNDQMAFVASRYSVESAIMAYDLRPNGDIDYANNIAFSREQVLNWLLQAATIVRENAPQQLITAGWQDEAEVTAPLVDFVSFQNYEDVDSLRQEIAVITAVTRRPVLLAEFGFNTFTIDELAQRLAYQRALEAVQRNNLAGWVAWTAFDYPLTVLCDEPTCPGEDGPDNRYGLWNTSYFPKRAIEVIEQATGVSIN